MYSTFFLHWIWMLLESSLKFCSGFHLSEFWLIVVHTALYSKGLLGHAPPGAGTSAITWGTSLQQGVTALNRVSHSLSQRSTLWHGYTCGNIALSRSSPCRDVAKWCADLQQLSEMVRFIQYLVLNYTSLANIALSSLDNCSRTSKYWVYAEEKQ